MKTASVVLILFCLGTVCASAQLGGFKKLGGLKKLVGGEGGEGGDVTAAITQSQDMLTYMTIATDNSVKAAEALASVFPPDVVQGIRDQAEKFHELRANEKTHDLDSQHFQLVKNIADETQKLDAQWQTHLKEKSAAIKEADARLALVILADGLAATKAPEVATALRSAVESLKSDPTQALAMKRMLSMAAVMAIIVKEAPQQVKSFTTVRGIVKRIAEAEKVQLNPDPSPEMVKDAVSMANSVKAIDDDPVPASGRQQLQ
jgi:hypothetical protein